MDVVEKLHYYIDRIKEKNKRLGAFVEVWEDDALKRAEELKAKAISDKKGKLYAYVIAVKDNILVEGKEITACSKILQGHISSYTATAVKKLVDEDAIIIGRTNMDEFAMGSSTENSSYFPSRNPINTDFVCGGSSGGSACAVAADMCDAALGSDTGGSVRQPAAFCGVWGLKPTYGCVSRYGLIAFASSLDQIGPISKDLETLKKVFDVIKGYDPCDNTSLAIPNIPHKDACEMKVGVIDFDKSGVDDDVISSFDSAVRDITNVVKNVKRVEIKHLKYAINAYYIISSSEASSNLARFDGVRYGKRACGDSIDEVYVNTRSSGFGREVKRRIMLGTYALSAGYYDEYYLKAQRVRNLIKQEFDEAFKDVDILVIPTTPTLPFKLGEKIDDPIKMYLNDIFTVPVNLAGICALSAPYGRSSLGFRYSVQFIGNRFCENWLFEIARRICDS
ncbi:MAG: Asp-tRNA(Asn)/Glu-tRNA(Gln) amidotransferase subunit GatA [Elusimicrobiales bacterium]